MRDGIAASGTCRRFSRPVLRNAVSSGGSSVTLLVGRSARFDGADAARRGGGAAGLPHARLLEEDAHGLAVTVAAAGDDGDGSGTDRELAGLLDSRALRVPEIVQPIDDLRGAERLALAQLQRSREHARQHALALAVEPRFDLTGEGHVVVAQNRRGQRPPGGRSR